MSWKFEITTEINYDWGDFLASCEWPHVFFHPSLVRAWLETYAPIRRLTPFIVRASDGINEALLPMVLWRKNWKNAFVRAVVPVGYSDFDYHDPLFKFRPSADSLKNFWNGLPDAVAERFDFDTFSTDGVTDFMTPAGEGWRKGEICPLLQLEDINSEAELMAFFRTSLRGDIRRQMRRLEEIGPLSFKEYSSHEDIAPETFREFMRQHSLRWPKAYKAPHFHERLLKEGLGDGTVHFSTLSVGSTEIAWHLGFSFQGRYYYYMPAGNQDFLKFSPTKIHLFYLVRRTVEQGYAVYDHLRGEENYKSGWSNASHHVNIRSFNSRSFTATVKHNLLKIRRLTPPPPIINH